MPPKYPDTRCLNSPVSHLNAQAWLSRTSHFICRGKSCLFFNVSGTDWVVPLIITAVNMAKQQKLKWIFYKHQLVHIKIPSIQLLLSFWCSIIIIIIIMVFFHVRVLLLVPPVSTPLCVLNLFKLRKLSIHLLLAPSSQTHQRLISCSTSPCSSWSHQVHLF